MTVDISRRHVLQGGTALFAALATGVLRPSTGQAAQDSIIVRVERDLANLDPANRVGPIDVNVINVVQQGLVSFKPGSTEWELDAAEEIKQTSDTEIEFKLRPGLAFTGGHGEMTAEDVKFSFERFIKPGPDGKKVTYADDWGTLDRVEVTGPLSGKIVLKEPSPALWVITLPDGSGRIMSRKATEELGDKIATTLVGSGPYVLKEWKPREQFVLEINPDYKGPIKPHFKQIVGKPIPEKKTAEIAFQADEIHFTEIEPASKPTFEAMPEGAVTEVPAIDYIWLGPNVEKKPFDDVRVRQALRLAVDVDAILTAAYGGVFPRANALLAPGLIGYWKDAPVYKRDIEAAKKLLADAGVGSGFKTKVTVLAQERDQTAATVIQANLAEVGIEVEIEALDEGAYWALGENDASKNLELSYIQYSGKFDPSFQTQWFTSNQVGTWNWQRWANKDFDALHSEGAKTVDLAKRNQIYVDAQKLMDESAAFVWITHNLYTFANKKWLEPGVLPNGNQWLYTAFKEK
jgi:peptide/nickel transport system substrate-binding protein